MSCASLSYPNLFGRARLDFVNRFEWEPLEYGSSAGLVREFPKHFELYFDRRVLYLPDRNRILKSFVPWLEALMGANRPPRPSERSLPREVSAMFPLMPEPTIRL